MADSPGIINAVYNDGFRAGHAEGRAMSGQERMCLRDEAFYAGQLDAQAKAPSRIKWFFLGMLLATTSMSLGIVYG